jgi:hypothetical protein
MEQSRLLREGHRRSGSKELTQGNTKSIEEGKGKYPWVILGISGECLS